MKGNSIIRDILFYLFVFGVVAFLISDGIKVPDEKKIVGIDIKGEVAAPGYYELEYESRLKDALIVAGGETEKADVSSLNLAKVLVDGEEIIIPKIIEGSDANENLINLNTADLYKLCKLDGIGEGLAAEIIRHRAENGPFREISDIKKVRGIGNAKFNKIKDKITVR